MRTTVHERRRTPRAKLSIPVHVRMFDFSCPEEICITLNVSRSGLYFVTSGQHYFRDLNVYVTRNFHPFDPINTEEKGTIVRVERVKTGKWGVAIRIPRTSKPEANSSTNRH
jgi:hypothetical protein